MNGNVVECNSGTLGCVDGSTNEEICGPVIPPPGEIIEITCANGNVVECNSEIKLCIDGSLDEDICGTYPATISITC